MDIDRLKRLSGLNESLTTPVNVSTNTDASTKASSKKAKENNKTPENKSASDVRTVDKKSAIDQNVVASLDDVNDDATNMTAGKKDVGGQKTISKGEKLNYTISLSKSGAPKVDDELSKEMVDVETWGESAEMGQQGYIVSSAENIYICHEQDDSFYSCDDRNKAVVISDQLIAEYIADQFTNSVVSRLMVEKDEKEDNKTCEKCKTEPCECEKEDKKDKSSCCDVDNEEDCKCEQQPCVCDDSSNLKETSNDMVNQINTRIQNGEDILISVNYKNFMFNGRVKKANDTNVFVTPTPQTSKHYNIQDKNIMLPAKPNQLTWSTKKPNILRGIVKDSETSVERPPAGGYPGSPMAGNTQDPSTWAVDMSGAKIKGTPLREYMADIKNTRKQIQTSK